MRKKKIALYTALVLLSVLLWSVAYALILDTTKTSAVRLLDAWAQTTHSQLETHVFYQAREMDQIQRRIPSSGGLDSIAKAQQHIDKMDHDISHRTFLLVDAQGNVYRNAQIIGTIPNQFWHNSINSSGYALTDMKMNQENRIDTEYLVMVVPLEASGEYFLAELLESSKYLSKLSLDVAIPTDYIGVYDEQGNVIAYKDTHHRPDQVVKSFQSALSVYSQDLENNVISTDFIGNHYNVFIPLNQNKGWFINCYVSIASIVPMYRQLHVIMIVCSVVWFLLAVIVILMDVRSERIKKYEMLRASQYDPLTGLANSAGMQGRIEKFLEKKASGEFALVCMDIVAFHSFNAMFGYTSGDTLLQTIGKVILEKYRCGARVNSDVFALIVPYRCGVEGELQEVFHQAIRREFGEQYVQLVVFKFGIYPILDTKHIFREIYDGALLALKEAKSLPKISGITYTQEMQHKADMQKIIEMNMLQALAREEFLVYIQPKSILECGKCIGGEALVRWQSEELGFIGPMDFIPLFEKNGFIIELDFYMLTNVLDILEKRHQSGEKLMSISVNQSRTTLTFPNYLPRLKKLLKKYTFPANYLEIEITESIVESNYDHVLLLMREMKELGLSVSMDDFGSGYSSLNALRELPVDILKIDKEFLEGSNTNERGKQIIVSVIHMAKAIGMKVICEGVETQKQYEFLKLAGCDYIQGYFFAKPMPYEEFEKKY